jgi:hypothetical protein
MSVLQKLGLMNSRLCRWRQPEYSRIRQKAARWC